MKLLLTLLISLASGSSLPAAIAQASKHVQPATMPIALCVWTGNTVYFSGQTANPATPADPATHTEAIYGDTYTQTRSVLTKLKKTVEGQGLTLADVAKMTVYLSGDPKLGNHLDYDGMQRAYLEFFGTADQPNKPARSTMQVAALGAPWALVEIELIGFKSE